MNAALFQHHMERTHGIVLIQTRGVDVGGGVLDTYMVYFTRVMKSVAYPVDGFPERANNPGRLR